MKKILIMLMLIPMLIPMLASAQELTNSIKNTDDSEVTSKIFTTSIKFKEFGISASKTDYQTSLYNKSSSGLLLLIDQKKEKYNILGNIGVGFTDNKNYLLGDISAVYKLNKNINLNAGIFGDLIDSNNALNKNITAQGLILGIDSDYDKFGISARAKNIWYNNHNQQHGYYLKPFYIVVEGIIIYATKKNYRNTNPYNGLYFSPEKYDRSGIGISTKQRVGSTIISGFFEQSKIKTPFSYESAKTWKLEMSTPINDTLKTKIIIGKDNNNGFFYKYNEVSIIWNFN